MTILEQSTNRSGTSRRWQAVGVGTCVVLTLLSGLVVGWLSVSFQLFGDRPDAGDYAAAAGGYGAAALVLLLGAEVVSRRGGPTWLLGVAFGGAALCTLLLLSSASDMAAADPSPVSNSWQQGAFGVLGCPWTWPLVVLAVVDGARRLGGRATSSP